MKYFAYYLNETLVKLIVDLSKQIDAEGNLIPEATVVTNCTGAGYTEVTQEQYELPDEELISLLRQP